MNNIKKTLLSVLASIGVSHALSLDEIGVLTPTRHDFSMYTHKKDQHVSHVIRCIGTWEPEVAFTLNTFINSGDTVLHFGGHIGFDDLVIAKKIGKQGKLFVFEPNPESFFLLSKNIELNHFEDRVQAFQVGVSDTNTKATLNFTYQNTGGGSLARMPEDSEFQRVDIVKVDDHLPELSNVSLVFMDIQGSELAALRGMKNILSRSPNCLILMEWETLFLKAMNEDMEGFLDQLFLEKRSFFKIVLDRYKGTVSYIPLEKKDLLEDQRGDILIVPNTFIGA